MQERNNFNDLTLLELDEEKLETQVANNTPIDIQKPRSATLSDKIIDLFLLGAEIANIGLVINVISQWYPAILIILYGAFSTIAHIADPIIYYLKALNRLARAATRSLLNIPLEDEQNGTYNWKTTVADLLSTVLFTATGTILLGVLALGPYTVAVGWGVGLISLAIMGRSEHKPQETYAHQEYLAAKTVFDTQKAKYESADHMTLEMENHLLELRAKRNEKYNAYLSKRRAKRLFIALLIGLTFLLLSGSIAVFAPPALIPVLAIISKIASAYLGLIAVGRASNWAAEKIQKRSLHPTPREHSENVYDPVMMQTQEDLYKTSLKRAIDRYQAHHDKSILGYFRKKASSSESLALLTSLQASLKSSNKNQLKSRVDSYLENKGHVGKTLHTLLKEEILPMTFRESLTRAIERYKNYKKGYVLGFFRKQVSSQESSDIIAYLERNIADTSNSDVHIQFTIDRYLNDENNSSKTFYGILTEELTEHNSRAQFAR